MSTYFVVPDTTYLTEITSASPSIDLDTPAGPWPSRLLARLMWLCTTGHIGGGAPALAVFYFIAGQGCQFTYTLLREQDFFQ